MIPQLKDSLGLLLTDPSEISEAFMSFYSKLYKSESPEDNSEMLNFFLNQDIPELSSENSKDLEAPLELAEVTEAIKLMQSGKSPGPDGYPVEFFIRF